MRALMLIGWLFLGCQTDCDKIWDHGQTLGAMKEADSERDRFDARCSAASPPQLQCALAADAPDAWRACFASGKSS